MSVFGVILASIFAAFSRIWTEYGETRIISPYSVQALENPGKMRTRKTPNTDTFYAVPESTRMNQKQCLNQKTNSKTVWVKHHDFIDKHQGILHWLGKSVIGSLQVCYQWLKEIFHLTSHSLIQSQIYI